MPGVLRQIYSRFAAQDALSNKLEPEAEAEVEALQPVDLGYHQEAPEMSTNSQTDQLIKRPAVDV